MGEEVSPRRTLPLVALVVGIALITGTPSVATGTIHGTADEPTALGDAEGCSSGDATPDTAVRAGPLRAAGDRGDLAGEERGYTDLETCTGAIRPGAEMNSPTFCTLNFVFTDGSSFYVGTAGHCVSTGDRVSANGVGTFGTVVMRVFDGGADDFALIHVDGDKEHLVDPTMCSYGGPTGIETDTYLPGLPLYEYGWGTATLFHPATRERILSNLDEAGGLTYWNGVGSGGDSGAPVVNDEGEAYAVHTTGITPVAGVVSEGGPKMTYILDLLDDHGFGQAELVLGDGFTRL